MLSYCKQRLVNGAVCARMNGPYVGVQVNIDKDNIDFRLDNELSVICRYRTVPSGWVGVWVDDVAVLRKS